MHEDRVAIDLFWINHPFDTFYVHVDRQRSCGLLDSDIGVVFRSDVDPLFSLLYCTASWTDPNSQFLGRVDEIELREITLGTELSLSPSRISLLLFLTRADRIATLWTELGSHCSPLPLCGFKFVSFWFHANRYSCWVRIGHSAVNNAQKDFVHGSSYLHMMSATQPGRTETGLSTVRDILRVLVIVIVLTVLGFFVPSILGEIGVYVMLGIEGKLAEFIDRGTLTFSAVLASIIVSELGYFGIGWLYIHRWLGRLGDIVRIPSLRESGLILGGAFLAFVGSNVISVLLSPYISDVETGVGRVLTEFPILLPVMIVLSIVLIGPAEELLYRGAIQGRLRRTFDGPVAILIAALLFTSVHAVGRTGSILAVALSLVPILFVGIVFGIAYERTGNVVVSMLVHGFYNALLFTIALFAPT